MTRAISEHNPKMVRRLNATLPPKLAEFVHEVTEELGLYETPSEFVRDLIRRYMENLRTTEQREINQLLKQSLTANNYTTLTKEDAEDIRNAIKE